MFFEEADAALETDVEDKANDCTLESLWGREKKVKQNLRDV